MSKIGCSVARLEDGPLISGAGKFAADISFPNQLHMRVVRSTVAHGILRSVDVAAALRHQGVAAAWTASDVAGIPPIGFRLTKIEGIEHFRQPVLARDKVRYVGEAIAVVFASDPYVAEDASELVKADIERLPPVLQVNEIGRAHV